MTGWLFSACDGQHSVAGLQLACLHTVPDAGPEEAAWQDACIRVWACKECDLARSTSGGSHMISTIKALDVVT